MFNELHHDDCDFATCEPIWNTSRGRVVLFSSVVEDSPQIEGVGHSPQVLYATYAVKHRYVVRRIELASCAAQAGVQS